MVDLTDVYMTFFLPTEQAGRIALGAEARLVLDAAPQYVVPAEVSFVADVAQFTPKTVETQEERQKLMFRIKARIAPDLLREHLLQVKTGLPGMAYVRLDPRVDWPPELQTRLPQGAGMYMHRSRMAGTVPRRLPACGMCLCATARCVRSTRSASISRRAAWPG